MLSDDDIKANIRKEAGEKPEKYYPVRTLKELGFSRHSCDKCKRWFWSIDVKQRVCGDAACSGGFRFINNTPAKNKLSYQGVWERFAALHETRGYTPIKRYPVIARWNPTTDFAIASIAAFQPYVVSGEVAPPANPLVIPQFCLRFPDVDNVGITGHFSGFVMMGQHTFVPPEKYDVDAYIQDHLFWLTKGMGMPYDELTLHEDAWGGGGNFGACIEFFSRGLEISNQVYMHYMNTPAGLTPLSIKVLDMGQGQERAAWFTQGVPSIYEAVFPQVMRNIIKATGINTDPELWAKFVPLSAYLNVGEVTDIEGAWQRVAKQLGTDAAHLKERVLPIAAMYAIGEHARALLVAIADGGLPSNVGGMYNLRVILRRALGFIDKYGWDLSLSTVCAWHAAELKNQFPELYEHIDEVHRVLEVELDKYRSTKQKTASVIMKIASGPITAEKMVELYDSQGIAPELIADEAQRQGRIVMVPDNFYAMVSKLHEAKEQEHATVRKEQLPLEGLPETKALYYDDWSLATFDARVLKVIGTAVVLDQTAFYPTSGGQLHDTGALGTAKVVDVFKQGSVIVHVLAEPAKLREGDKVNGAVDFERRKQLAQHHTATHIVNAAARKTLGSHINQASAKKDIDKAHLDITHYQPLTDEELRSIETEANRTVQQAITTKLSFIARSEAEAKYGMGLYQGGAVPGKQLRIVEIPGVDVEACGGTHLHSTAEAGRIVLLRASKVKDGIVRIEFAAGAAAERVLQQEKLIVEKAAALLDCEANQVPARCSELFDKWRKARKGKLADKHLTSTASSNGNILAEAAEILQTQPEHVVKTIERFLREAGIE
ncbi:alanine--tRNA ligase [Candidatus Woesearchaeota archaeon]|nr:alanine--tRNA ligase [Candidatus Woesearchaeota archaeon]